ncbi:MAG: WYL domain-containing protein [Thalassobaculales bacterium]
MSSTDPDGPQDGPALRWSVERRLDFIEQALYWRGTINRADLVAAFGISPNQATADLARYQGLAPGNLAYDHRARHYVAAEPFVPVLGPIDPAPLLARLRLAGEGVTAMPGDDAFFPVPPFDLAGPPGRRIDPAVLRAVLWAIRDRAALAVTYRSLSREAREPRVIEPHALAHDGFRWHARAWCRASGSFRDFVLGRIGEPRRCGPAAADPAGDADWHSICELVVMPHPRLGPAARAAIEADYGMQEGRLTLRVRQALAFYLKRRLGLDIRPEDREPTHQHIVLATDGAAPSVETGADLAD